MASPDQVRQYLAYWFQLGKRVVFQSDPEALLPQPVMQNGRYSPQFEACWQRIQQSGGQDAYLEGTTQSVSQLLSSTWAIEPCARCDMPVPVLDLGVQPVGCPCDDLAGWPDTTLPQPRSPINSHSALGRIRDRLSDVPSNK